MDGSAFEGSESEKPDSDSESTIMTSLSVSIGVNAAEGRTGFSKKRGESAAFEGSLEILVECPRVISSPK